MIKNKIKTPLRGFEPRSQAPQARILSRLYYRGICRKYLLTHLKLYLLMNEKQAIALLKKYSKADERVFNLVLSHSLAVQKVALDLAKDIPDLDINLIKTGSLLHDIGRFNCPPKTELSIKHGIKGAEILRKEGHEALAKIAERHIGAGISKQDIIEQKLNLPKKDFMPIKKEEKIIACADNLVFGERIGTIEEIIRRFTKEVSPKIGRRAKDLYDEIMGMKKK
jgi:uncharacterized protein (TIGR00295 family)